MIRALFVLALQAFSTSHTVYVTEHNAFNASRGDVVVMVMDDTSPAAVSRCLDAGGEPIYNARSGVLYCEGIDF